MSINVTMDDHDLLREYTEQGSEKAFSDLVERYLPLVYGTAFRIVRDAHTAQDVAQSVFLQLARKAWTVREGRALPGWLYRCTQRAAFMAIRSEQRRTRRETEAMNLAEQNQSPAMAWEQISPLLDEALSHLSRGEQDAVILRFFQEKSYREVGVMCGLNENAARKRVERSLDKIRVHFASRGLTATAAILGTILAAHASEPPPLGLATRVAKSAASNAAKVGGLTYFASQVFLYVTNLKVLGAVVVVAGLAAIPLLNQHWENTQMQLALADSTRQVKQLQLEMANLNGRLGDAEKLAQSAADSARKQSAGFFVSPSTGNMTVQLDIATIAQINFSTIDAKKYALTTDAVGLLAITPEEAAKLQDLIERLKVRVQDHARAAMQRIPVDSLTGPNFVAFFKNHPGDQSLYLIPPITADDAKALVDWFTDGVKGIIGPERGAILVQRGSAAFDTWVTSGQGTAIAFADSNSSDNDLPAADPAAGPVPVTAWMIKQTIDGKFVFTRGRGKKAVPDQLAYLFSAAPDEGTVSPAAPATSAVAP